ncbi:MAG TPA: glycoside hydrolase family 99-like domain-containing protein [Casimicrobiaceae bacterium]|nr:glycoside hydrolase family 99-like domain-containing protein [Casimicrobiaceae bacterium]
MKNSHTSPQILRAIAFYLPQFHPIPENDRWWGKGFTEWTNVTRAQANFAGHFQPHLPSDSGFYDLRVSDTLVEQAALARSYGIHGFCYYYYWFAGKRLLERPLEQMLASGKPDFPYCLCWANENWTRRWDGAELDILIAQKHSPSDDERFIRELLPHLRDSRYIRVNGKPLIVVYHVGILPEPRRTASLWREVCRNEGIAEPYLCAAKTHREADPANYAIADPATYGFDAIVEFPPHGLRTPAINARMEITNPDFAGTIVDYREFVLDYLVRAEPDYVTHPTVMPGWDNTPRRREHALTFVNATPEIYEVWLREVVLRTIAKRQPEEQLVFINAWNEWAEGAHLEPDRRYGHQFLRATQRALADAPAGGLPFERFSGRRAAPSVAR